MLPGRRLHKEPYCCPVRVQGKLYFPLFVRSEFVELEGEAILAWSCRIGKAQTKLTIERPSLERWNAELWSSRTPHAMKEERRRYLTDYGSCFPVYRRARFPSRSESFHSHLVHPLNLKPFLASHHPDVGKINPMIHDVWMKFLLKIGRKIMHDSRSSKASLCPKTVFDDAKCSVESKQLTCHLLKRFVQKG